MEVSLHRNLAELRSELQEQLSHVLESARHIVLPSGYIVGERVVSKIDYQIDKGHISRDDVGIVKGFSTGEDRSRVSVDFPNLRSVNMLPSQMKREAGEVDVAMLTPLGGSREALGGDGMGTTKSTAAQGSPRDGSHKKRPPWASTMSAASGNSASGNSANNVPAWSGPGNRAAISMVWRSQNRTPTEVLQEMHALHAAHLDDWG
eukprot:CAMPEP_0203934778 /NCGR_PEP_ID=MMETSP0359-20131031/72654_1 /ASSEMBLY_ACC=CAM_ASM_000338 /TAXON_ID=268821 /ORGANISM="Scrippsiella Hangoei, Strain SHTV-5" /LENGTH=204 /DNA_ID=CAMNT_0050864525 /DNA_START=9 /DNA_END=619 /DNA_ORIENTATION=-